MEKKSIYCVINITGFFNCLDTKSDTWGPLNKTILSYTVPNL